MPYVPKTTLEQLQEVEASITAVTAGCQEYTIDGVTRKYPALNTLYAERIRLQKEYSDSTGARPRVSVSKFGGAAW